jgi:hypothetical protein
MRAINSAVVSACTYNEATSAEARNTVEPTSSAYVDYVWSGHLKSRGLVSVSNEEVHWNSGTINIIDAFSFCSTIGWFDSTEPRKWHEV